MTYLFFCGFLDYGLRIVYDDTDIDINVVTNRRDICLIDRSDRIVPDKRKGMIGSEYRRNL